MTPLAFIVGTLIIGFCLICASFIVSGAITGAAAVTKESAPQPLQQPTLAFLTEFDAADYIGITLEELDYMRNEGMLDDTFIAVTSMEQTGEEEYTERVDGVERVKVRPVTSPVTRFLFNRQLLDERILELIHEGQHVNPTRGRSGYKKKQQNGGQKPQQEKPVKNVQKNSENRPEQQQNRDGQKPNNNGQKQGNGQKQNNGQKPNNGQKQNNGQKPNNGQKQNNGQKPNAQRPQRDDDDDFGKKKPHLDDYDDFGKKKQTIDDDDDFGKKKPVFDDDDDFGKKKPAFDDDGFGSADDDDDGFGDAGIVYEDDDDDMVDIDGFGKPNND